MSDFEEKLNAILSNPESMGQIMNLAQSLNLGGGGEPSGDGTPPPQPSPDAAPSGGGIPDGLSGLGSLLGQIDPKLGGCCLWRGNWRAAATTSGCSFCTPCGPS